MKRLGSLVMVLLVCALLTTPAIYASSAFNHSSVISADTIPYPGPDDTDDDGGCGGGGDDSGNDSGPDSTDDGSSGWGGNDDGPDSTGGVLF